MVERRLLMTDLNCISYWLPLLQAAGVEVPRTEIVATKCDLVMLLDGQMPDGYEAFIEALEAAVRKIGVPCFLRTGHTSGKHDWRSTCHVTDITKIRSHVTSLVDYSECVSLMGLPVNMWTVREFIQLDAPFETRRGMPVAREFRFFVRGGAGLVDGEILCFHPYWPDEALEAQRPTDPEWRVKLAELNLLDDKDLDALRAMAAQAGKPFSGDWSIDFAHAMDGRWIAIDMAEAKRSFHWEGCNAGR